ncbi:hypothetical protein C3Y87_14660 [Carbonactinospora thermoautotrophica]|nr:hypothetical protein [Carbonactinospora thermoautotrophica]
MFQPGAQIRGVQIFVPYPEQDALVTAIVSGERPFPELGADRSGGGVHRPVRVLSAGAQIGTSDRAEELRVR